jgi:hypothetical protein|nr:MAG TPA: hypothetical protein [Caudoviricetes sp.]
MRPVNEKSLFHALCEVMDKTMSGEYSTDQAIAVVKTSNELTKLLRLEHDRARLQMEIYSFNKDNNSDIEIRELASKGFDNTTAIPDGICYDKSGNRPYTNCEKAE